MALAARRQLHSPPGRQRQVLTAHSRCGSHRKAPLPAAAAAKGADWNARCNVRAQGYARVPRYDEAALMEAVYSRGPVAISFDASHPAFAFYSSGVYYDAQVGTPGSGCVDHATLHSCLQVQNGRPPST